MSDLADRKPVSDGESRHAAPAHRFGENDSASRSREPAAALVPEFKDKPCNICGRGWPYHEDACAYKQVALEHARFRTALETIVRTSKLGGAVEIARRALNNG